MPGSLAPTYDPANQNPNDQFTKDWPDTPNDSSPMGFGTYDPTTGKYVNPQTGSGAGGALSNPFSGSAASGTATPATGGVGASGVATGAYAPGSAAAAGAASGGTGAAAGGVLSTAAQVLPWIQFAASMYEAQKSGKFVQPPMSPEQKQMFDFAMHYIQTTPDNRQTINNMLQFDLAHGASLDIDALKAGKTGYAPAQHMPGADLATMIRNQAGASPTDLPQAATARPGGSPGIADTIRGIQSP
jgi:hypothetical protein